MDEKIPEKLDNLRDAMYSRVLAPKITERDRRALSRDVDMLPRDWQHPDESTMAPSMVAPAGINIARTLAGWMVAIAALFFVVAFGYFIYFFTIGAGTVGSSAHNVDITVHGPTTIVSSNKTELQVTVTNHNSSALRSTQLIVTYPPGTRSPVDYSTPEVHRIIALDTVAPGQSVQGVVPAVFNGVQGTQGAVKIEVTYRLDSSNAVFTAATEYAFTYGSTPLSIVVDGTTETVSGQPIEINATISSNASAPIKDAVVGVSVPFGFTVTDAEPKLDAHNVMHLGDMLPGSKQQITIQGKLTGADQDARFLKFTAGTFAGATSTTVDIPLAQAVLPLTIARPFLSMNMIVNDIEQGSSTHAVLSPGSKTRVTISYVNNLSTPILHGTIVAKFTGTAIDPGTITVANGFFRSNDNTVIWNDTTDPALSSIAPGAKGRYDVSFNAPSATLSAGTPNVFAMNLSAAGSRVGDKGAIETLQSATTQSFVVSSNVILSANGLYYSSPYGPTGPMPPRVAQETNYAMVFTVQNTLNPIKNAKIVARLPVYVRSTGKSSPSYEHIKFNQTNSSVEWDVGDIAPGTGLTQLSRQAAFEVAFTPSVSQVGQRPILLQDIILTGTDATTGEPIYISSTSSPTLSNVTSDLKGDKKPGNLDPSVVQ